MRWCVEFLRAGYRGTVDDVLRAWLWLATLSRSRKRAMLFLAVVLGLPLAAASPAFADGGGNVWLTVTGTKDSHGFTASQYELSLDSGGWTDPAKAVSSWLAGMGWMIYRFWVSMVLWLMDFVLQFKQLALLRPPFDAIGEALNRVVTQVGVIPTIAVVAILFSGFVLFRGRHGAAIGEMGVTMVIAALIGTAVAHPMAWVGGDNGLLANSQQAGLAVSAEFLAQAQAGGAAGTPKATDAAGARSAIEGRVVDVLVRQPHQLINYGESLDTKGGPCLKAYDKAIKGGDTDARTAVGDACGKTAQDASSNPLAAVMGVAIVAPSGGFFFLVVLILAVALIVLTGITLWEAGKFILELARALIPGSSRLGVFVCAGVILVTSIFAGLCVVALTVLLLILSSVFASTATWPAPTVFIVVDLVLVGGAIALVVLQIRAKKHGRRLGEGLGKALASRPVSLPQGGSVAGTLRSAAAPAMMLRQQAMMRRALTPAGEGGKGPRQPLRAAGKLAFKGAKLAAASTIGAPVFLPKAAAATKVALGARKTAMTGKLASAAAGATNYGKEYVHNVGAAGRFAGKTGGFLAMAATAGGAHAAGAVAGMAGVDPRIAATTFTAGARAAAAAASIRASSGRVQPNRTGGPVPTRVQPSPSATPRSPQAQKPGPTTIPRLVPVARASSPAPAPANQRRSRPAAGSVRPDRTVQNAAAANQLRKRMATRNGR